METLLVREDEGNSSHAQSESVTLLGQVLGPLDELAPLPEQRLSAFFVDEEGLLDEAHEALAEDDSIDEEDDDYDDALFSRVTEHYTWFDATELGSAAGAIRERLAARRDAFPKVVESVQGYALVDDVLAELDRLIMQAEQATKDGVRVALCTV